LQVAIGTQQLVGREEEFASLVGLLDGAPSWTAVVAGDAGIGKTALWLVARDEAASRGFLLLSARPAEAEVAFSFSGLADLLGDVVPDVLDERRIAELVAAGRSNREVAAARFLTEHSVETALTRIYRKLGVRSRTELASRLREPPA
jgi:ATP/maltotriose-dependent transcriptional regulator MalT